MTVITSRSNAQVKRVRALQSRRERDRTGLFFAEGLRVVSEAFAMGYDVDLLVAAPERLPDAGLRLVEKEQLRGLPVLEVTPEVFDSLSFREEAQGIGVVAHQRWSPLPESTDGDRAWVAIHEVQHPGNLGTVIRTNDAVGGSGVILSGASTDAYHPQCVRGSLGAVFSQRLVRTTLTEFLEWAPRSDCQVVGTSPAGRVDYREVSYRAPVLVLMGNERAGLLPEQLTVCDEVVRIPMAGRVESLNLSIAAALVLYEVLRQLQT